MCKFIKIDFEDDIFLSYMPQIKTCYLKYCKRFQDDFSGMRFENFINSVGKFFWIILDYKNQFMGFVYLDDFIGNFQKLYSAEITVCFLRPAWGIFVRYCSKFFLKKCFDEFGLFKLRALIYPDNRLVCRLLKDCGFVYEVCLKNETLRNGNPQDLYVYALYRDYFYK